MASGLLSLKWNHHRSTFLHVLANIRQKESYCDVTIACDGKFYSAHKLVLSTCSEYFEGMFERTQCKHPVIVLKDIGSDELEALLSYMYDGEVNVLQENLSNLIKAAECLKIKGLAVADHDPSEQSKDKSSISNSSKDVNRSHSISNSYHSDSSSRFRNSNSNSSISGGVKRQNFSSKQDDSQAPKRRRPDSSPQSSSVIPLSPSQRSSSEDKASGGASRTPSKTENSVDQDAAAVTEPGGAGDPEDSIDAALGAADDQASSDVPDDNRTFAQGLSEETGVKAEPVEIIDSDDMGGYDNQGDTHDASDAEFTEEKFSGGGGASGGGADGDPNSLWGTVAGDGSDLFSQPSTSAFTGQDGTSNNDNGKGGSSSGPVLPNSPQLRPAEALWFLDQQRSLGSTLQQQLDEPPFSVSSLHATASSATSLFRQHLDPIDQIMHIQHGLSPTDNIQIENTSPTGMGDITPRIMNLNRHNRRNSDSSTLGVVPILSPNQLDCPMCPYKATVNSRLKEHIRQHTGERPFVCPVCHKGFGRKTHLDTHIVIHSGDKPFKCTMCSYSATQKGNLKIHMQSHSGMKPHSCMYCGYRAAQKMTLRLHMYNKHPDLVSGTLPKNDLQNS